MAFLFYFVTYAHSVGVIRTHVCTSHVALRYVLSSWVRTWVNGSRSPQNVHRTPCSCSFAKACIYSTRERWKMDMLTHFVTLRDLAYSHPHPFRLSVPGAWHGARAFPFLEINVFRMIHGFDSQSRRLCKWQIGFELEGLSRLLSLCGFNWRGENGICWIKRGCSMWCGTYCGVLWNSSWLIGIRTVFASISYFLFVSAWRRTQDGRFLRFFFVRYVYVRIFTGPVKIRHEIIQPCLTEINVLSNYPRKHTAVNAPRAVGLPPLQHTRYWIFWVGSRIWSLLALLSALITLRHTTMHILLTPTSGHQENSGHCGTLLSPLRPHSDSNIRARYLVVTRVKLLNCFYLIVTAHSRIVGENLLWPYNNIVLVVEQLHSQWIWHPPRRLPSYEVNQGVMRFCFSWCRPECCCGRKESSVWVHMLVAVLVDAPDGGNSIHPERRYDSGSTPTVCCATPFFSVCVRDVQQNLGFTCLQISWMYAGLDNWDLRTLLSYCTWNWNFPLWRPCFLSRHSTMLLCAGADIDDNSVYGETTGNLEWSSQRRNHVGNSSSCRPSFLGEDILSILEKISH